MKKQTYVTEIKDVRLTGLTAKLALKTGINCSFRQRLVSSKSKFKEYHIIPPIGSDDGFHVHYAITYGIRWFRNPEKAVNHYIKARKSWLLSNKHRRVLSNISASLPAITQPPLGKAGGVLLP